MKRRWKLTAEEIDVHGGIEPVHITVVAESQQEAEARARLLLARTGGIITSCIPGGRTDN